MTDTEYKETLSHLNTLLEDYGVEDYADCARMCGYLSDVCKKLPDFYAHDDIPCSEKHVRDLTLVSRLLSNAATIFVDLCAGL